MNSTVSLTSREEIEVHRFSWLISIGIPLLAIFIPNALGIILYFVLREPMMTPCPQCSTLVKPGFAFCPACGTKLGAALTPNR